MFAWLKKILFAPPPPPPPVAQRPRPAVPPAPAPAPRQASSTGITYDPGLIDQYQADHRHLLALYGKAKQAAEQGQWTKVEETLRVFGAALTDHLLSERVRLYVYLNKSVADDPGSVDLMRQFSTEMHGIGKVVTAFLNDQSDLSQVPTKQVAFLATWQSIGQTLGDRIAREEKTLYPMYRAAS